MQTDDDGMEWESASPHHNPPPAHITSLPFDIFLELVKALDVWEVLQLRLTCKTLYHYSSTESVWIILAETLTKRRPIPLPPFRTRASLNFEELQEAVCRAARLERSLFSNYGRMRSPPRILHEPGRAHGDTLVLLPGGRHLVTGATSGRGDGVGGMIRVWDLTTGDRLASFEVRPEDDILQWRPVEDGRAVMFLVRDGILSNANAQHYHLLRLEFSEGLYSTHATFFHHSSLRQELPVADTSLSEDVVLVLGIDTDNTISMFILNWRDGTMVFVKTDVTPPEHPYFSILTLDQLSIWVDSPSSPRTYSFPVSDIYPHLAFPPKHPIFLPQPVSVVLNHISNINPSPPEGFLPLYRDTTRKWPTSPRTSLLARPLSILHVHTNPETPGNTMTCLSHEYLSTNFSAKPSDRTFFAPLSILSSPIINVENGQTVEYPIIAAESAQIVFPEIQPTGEIQLKSMSLPGDNPEVRHYPPNWYNEHLIRPLESPPELNLRSIVMMNLDDASGVLAIAVEGGDIFILEY
ncbi:hypothetical protein M422DRAFT_776543 [Sphaerobolus stellatus SS14]|nr:hypothetical protein M422DRAFT_776543 [Sphaerobolus stellatus SS14]